MRRRAGRRAEDRGGGPGGLAGSRLRLLAAASPPPAGRYHASRIPPGPRTELPGLGVGADSAVRARRRRARSRPTSGWRGEAGDTSPAARRGTAPRWGPGHRLGSAVPPDLPARPAQAGTAFRAAGATDGDWGRSLTGKFPGIEGLASGPP